MLVQYSTHIVEFVVTYVNTKRTYRLFRPTSITSSQYNIVATELKAL